MGGQGDCGWVGWPQMRSCVESQMNPSVREEFHMCVFSNFVISLDKTHGIQQCGCIDFVVLSKTSQELGVSSNRLVVDLSS